MEILKSAFKQHCSWQQPCLSRFKINQTLVPRNRCKVIVSQKILLLICIDSYFKRCIFEQCYCCRICVPRSNLFLGSFRCGDIDEDVRHRISAGCLKWRQASGILCDRGCHKSKKANSIGQQFVRRCYTVLNVGLQKGDMSSN